MFLGRVGGLTVATVAASAVAAPLAAAAPIAPAPAASASFGDDDDNDDGPKGRSQQAEKIRRDAAKRQRDLPDPGNKPNGDEARYAGKIGSFSKCLPHNQLGEVDPAAFAALVRAMNTGKRADFEAIPMGGSTKLKNPQAGFAFDLQGPDAHALHLAAPPAFASAETAAEAVELYWQALTRDVPYLAYGSDPLVEAAAAELSTLKDFTGPKVGDKVTPDTIFRSYTAGDLVGPYISQFLALDVPFGAMTVKQAITTLKPGVEYLTDYNDWLSCQSGGKPKDIQNDGTARYIRNARDLAEYVHRDYSYQPYMNAALILFGLKAPLDPANPYNGSKTQGGDGTFGLPAVLDLVARITINATKTSWYHKWSIHRRLRPEAYGGRVHNHKTGKANYPIHEQVLKSQAVARVSSKHGTFLLPMAYPEGSPTHPAYPAAHAVLAGAAVTALKAVFKEDWVIPQPKVANAEGTGLDAWGGAPLTVGNELDKLAGNIAKGRDAAGVHWRSDGIEGIKLGEALALNYLAETRALWNEEFEGYTVTKFDGTKVTV
jgi:hypothetical protein